MARNSTEWWPPLERFHPRRAKAERQRWSIPLARLSERSGLDRALLTRFESGGLRIPPPGFRERVYWALRLLILEHARRMITVLEAVEGADAQASLRSRAIPSTTFLGRLQDEHEAEIAAAIQRAKKPDWAHPRHRHTSEEERATFGARMQAAREAARATKEPSNG